MKNILKYALILAAASLAGAVYAQTATVPASQDVDGMKITSSIKDGVVNIHIYLISDSQVRYRIKTVHFFD